MKNLEEDILKLIDEELESAPLEHTGDATLARKVIRIGYIKKRIRELFNKYEKETT